MTGHSYAQGQDEEEVQQTANHQTNRRSQKGMKNRKHRYLHEDSQLSDETNQALIY